MKISEHKFGYGKVAYIKEFESLSEFEKHCDTALINKTAFYTQSSVKGSEKFTMTESYEAANNLLISGWTQGAEKLTKQLKVANASNQAKEVKKAIYDIVGFQASVPRYLQGIPTNMVNKKIVKQKQKVVTLVKSIDYLANIKPQQILDDSIKFLQIVQGIEAKGIRVNADVTLHAVKGKEQIFTRVAIKKASERLNLSKMSYPLLHPSFLRRHLFRAMETETRVNGAWCPGYGGTGDESDTKELLRPNEYFIPILISEYKALNILSEIN